MSVSGTIIKVYITDSGFNCELIKRKIVEQENREDRYLKKK